jgi:hypothetical protein
MQWMAIGRERAAMRRMGFAYQVDDGRLPISVLAVRPGSRLLGVATKKAASHP